MKKKNPGADNNHTKNKKKMPQKDDSTPKNLPPKEDMPLNHGKENNKQNPPSPHKKPYQQQSEGIDQNVIPEHTGRIPDELREEVEENRKISEIRIGLDHLTTQPVDNFPSTRVNSHV